MLFVYALVCCVFVIVCGLLSWIFAFASSKFAVVCYGEHIEVGNVDNTSLHKLLCFDVCDEKKC